jgi:DnaA family protein
MMQQPYRQLPLTFEPRERYTFDAFVDGQNRLAVDLVRQMALAEGEAQMLLWAGKGNGKSHLLQAACNLAAQSKLTACYLPANQFIGQPVQLFDGLERLDLVCIDDVDAMMQSMHWEEALFDLINRMRDAAGRILFAAGASPESCPIRLADLRSRLSWGPVFHLHELDDEDKIRAMQKRAQLSGLEMTDHVANYLLTHYPRALFDLFERLDRLDKASMAMQRKLTIPFIKSVLESESNRSR